MLCLSDLYLVHLSSLLQSVAREYVLFLACVKLILYSTKVCIFISLTWASLVTQMVKHLPAMQETWVQSLGREDPLEKEMETHSSTLAWKIPWMEKRGRL